MLGQFVVQQADLPELIDTALKDQDMDSVRRMVHSLKRLAGTLGMHQLQTISASYENLVRNGGTARELNASLGTLKEEITAVCEQIRQMNIPMAVESNAVEPAQLKSMVCRLADFLKKNDMRAYKIWEKLDPALATVIGGEGVDTLKQQIEHFDFSQALSTLETLIACYPEQLMDD